MKSKVVLFVTGYILLIFSSCLNSDEVEYEISRDPQIASFTLSHDSISGLSDVNFVIDQVEGEIYNRDSLPFGTDISQKLWATITFSTAVVEVEIYQQATGDTIYWSGNTENDSINFTKPINIKTTAADNLTTKRYLGKLNVHQVMPDTMEWRNIVASSNGVFNEPVQEQKVVIYPEGGNNLYMYAKTGSNWNVLKANTETPTDWEVLDASFSYDDLNISQMTVMGDWIFAPGKNGELYYSEDRVSWNQNDNFLLYDKVNSIVGVLSDGTDSRLILVVEDAGNNYFASLQVIEDEFITTIVKEESDKIPSDFPLENFSNINYENINNSPRLIVFAGESQSSDKPAGTAWFTNDGFKWEPYAGAKIPYTQGASIVKYDDQLYMIGGFYGNTASKEIYISRDRGLNWKESGTLVALPKEYKARGNSSVLVDKDNYMFIFGGKESADSADLLDEIWRGRINRLGFAIPY